MATTLTWKKTALAVAAGPQPAGGAAAGLGAGVVGSDEDHLREIAGRVVHHVPMQAVAECSFRQAPAESSQFTSSEQEAGKY
jgi:hypothetical protein